MTEWPVEGDFVMPAKDIPDVMKDGMGEAARDWAKLRKAHGLKNQLKTSSHIACQALLPEQQEGLLRFLTISKPDIGIYRPDDRSSFLIEMIVCGDGEYLWINCP